MAEALRSLPSVDRLLSDERVAGLTERYSRQAVVDLVRDELASARLEITNGSAAPDMDRLVDGIGRSAEERWGGWPRRVLNATGVILHTNLGRAPLGDDAIEAIRSTAAGYSDLELDLRTGARGSRQAYISRLVGQLTGAESALVVNNNASAVLLGLAAVASGRTVIVSRGEAVEIGGGFRIPDVLRQSGATLIEVGATNRTYAGDYEAAISADTGAILAVHASNFKVMGFTHSPSIPELVEVGRRHDVPVLHDLGSGCLLDTSAYGLAREPTPQHSIGAGVGLAFFSGDKLLGGPQAGIIAGRRDLVSRVARHPMARAVRIDKLSMAALAATLLHYVKGEAPAKIPVWRMVSASVDDLERRARRWSDALGQGTSASRSVSTVGGGSLPGETLPSWAVTVDPEGTARTAGDLSARLRRGDPSVIGRTENDTVLLDTRTVLPDQDEELLRAVKRALE